MKPRATQLDGWKEIACHLKRSVRCVQRWARNERLPVKRHRHRGGVSVYAFPDELDSWWRNEWSNWNESPNKTADLSVRNKSEGKREPAEGEGRIAGIDHCDTRNQHEIEQIAWGGALFFLWVLQAKLLIREHPLKTGQKLDVAPEVVAVQRVGPREEIGGEKV